MTPYAAVAIAILALLIGWLRSPSDDAPTFIPDTVRVVDDPIVNDAREGASAAYLAHAGIDTTDVGAMADTVRLGQTLPGPTALYLGLRGETGARDAILERLGRADGAGRDVALVEDLLFALYVMGDPATETAARAVADSLAYGLYPSGGRITSFAYEAALRVLIALGDTSQIGIVADSAAAGCTECNFYLDRLVQADSSLYPAAEQAVLAGLAAGRLTVDEAVIVTLQMTPEVASALLAVLDRPDRLPEHYSAIVTLGPLPAGRPATLDGPELAGRLEALLLAETDPSRQRDVLELAVAFRRPITVRIVERAARGDYGPELVGTGTDALDRRRLDRAPSCEGREATVYISPGGLVVGGDLDGQPYAGLLRGTDGDDVMVGTDGADQIVGFAGDDVLCGLGGDDLLQGNGDADVLYGGPGDDVLAGGNGGDTIYGGEGTDEARGGRGNDACDAEAEDSCEREIDE